MQSWGPEGGSRAIVCLVHGLGEHSGRYAHVGAALCSGGYALFAFDLRGHGKSEGLRGHTPSYERLMDDIHDFLGKAAARYPGKPRFLYGHSLGGSLVLNYVLRRKPKLAGVVVTSPGLRPAIAPPGWKLASGRLMYKARPTFQMPNGLDLGGLSHDPAVIRAYAGDPLCHDRLSAQLGLDILSSGEYVLAQAKQFPLPLLLMHGNSDRLTSCAASREFAAALPTDRCTFREWDGCYHELHNEPQQADVLRAMITWMDAHLPVVAPVKVTGRVLITPKSGGRKNQR